MGSDTQLLNIGDRIFIDLENVLETEEALGDCNEHSSLKET